MTLLAVVMGRGGPSNELHPCRPPASLLALPVLGSIFIHTSMNVLGQLSALFITTSQEWCAKKTKTALHQLNDRYCILNNKISFFYRFVPLNSTVFGHANLPNMEDTSVFAVSGFQYIIMAVVVTKGYPHKKPLYHNGESSENRGQIVSIVFKSSNPETTSVFLSL